MLERQWRAQCAELAAADAVHRHAAGHGQRAAAPAPFNLVMPRSACPHCHAPIAAWHNIPVLSWLLLRGRCASCRRADQRRAIRWWNCSRGVLIGAGGLEFGFGCRRCWRAGGHLVPDRAGRHRPRSPAAARCADAAAAVGSACWPACVAGQRPAASLPVDPRRRIIGAAAGYLCLWSVYHLFRLATGKEGMGYGDFKLLAALGAWLGWQMLLPIVLMSATVGRARRHRADRPATPRAAACRSPSARSSRRPAGSR